MKKCILSCVVAMAVAYCHAQSQFGIFAGPQITSSKYSIRGNHQKNTPKYGLQAGFGWKIPFDVNLYFAPAAFYSLKGYKVKFDEPSLIPDKDAIDNNTSIHTFELAFLLQYDLGKKANHFFIKMGPTLDFQLSGKEKYNLQNGTHVDRDMVFSFGDYGRYAASVLFHLGYETKCGLIVAAQYTHGLGSINNVDNGPRIYHRAYGLSVGKYLKKRK